MRGWEIFEVSLHSWWMDANFPILWRTSYFACLRPPLSNFVQPIPPLPCHLKPLTPLFFLFSCFFGWMGDHATFDVLHYLADLQMSSLGTLVPEGPWCMFYATRHKFAEVWHIMCFYCTLIWYHTQTDKYKQHTQGYSRKTHPYIYKKWLFKKYSLVKVIYLLIRCYRTRFFLWNTNNTNRNRVNKQNTHTYTHTHTKQSEKDNTGKG